MVVSYSLLICSNASCTEKLELKEREEAIEKLLDRNRHLTFQTELQGVQLSEVREKLDLILWLLQALDISGRGIIQVFCEFPLILLNIFKHLLIRDLP